jgi:hypothetical protein
VNAIDYFSTEMVARENAFHERVLKSPANGRVDASIDLDSTWSEVSTIMLQSLSKQQMQVFGREFGSVTPQEYDTYCLAAETMMKAIAQLPPHKAAAVARSLFP